MKRITKPMFRYGDADFDKDYMTWGLHNKETQLEEADSILRIVNSSSPLRILDLACGIGTHAIHFAQSGHVVTAVDLSASFIEKGRRSAAENGVDAIFEVNDIKRLDYNACFDLVVWIEKSFVDDAILRAIYKYIDVDGFFICDIRNPDHPKTKRLSSNWRNWHEKDGVFYLEYHETNDETKIRSSEWIEIDTNKDTINQQTESHPINPGIMHMLNKCGFRDIEYRTMAGDIYTEGEEPYWLWVIARK